jgi:hypothetical protein
MEDVKSDGRRYRDARVFFSAMFEAVKKGVSRIKLLTPLTIITDPIMEVSKSRTEHKFDKRIAGMLFLPSERPSALIIRIVSYFSIKKR